MQVAKELKSLVRRFKFNDAIEAKGEDKARIHYGTSAQEVIAVFAKYNLDAMEYGMVCYDEWEEEPEVKDEEGNVITEAKPESIEEYTEIETQETGETTKNVKYSIIYLMMLKGMQEQQAIIDDLKARIAFNLTHLWLSKFNLAYFWYKPKRGKTRRKIVF